MKELKNYPKYCAFGIGYLDCKGEIIEESENYFIVKPDQYNNYYKLALTKDSRLTKVFDSEIECDNWIKEQKYEYDNR
jgi:hypothetical protein